MLTKCLKRDCVAGTHNSFKSEDLKQHREISMQFFCYNTQETQLIGSIIEDKLLARLIWNIVYKAFWQIKYWRIYAHV